MSEPNTSITYDLKYKVEAPDISVTRNLIDKALAAHFNLRTFERDGLHLSRYQSPGFFRSFVKAIPSEVHWRIDRNADGEVELRVRPDFSPCLIKRTFRILIILGVFYAITSFFAMNRVVLFETRKYQALFVGISVLFHFLSGCSLSIIAFLCIFVMPRYQLKVKNRISNCGADITRFYSKSNLKETVIRYKKVLLMFATFVFFVVLPTAMGTGAGTSTYDVSQSWLSKLLIASVAALLFLAVALIIVSKSAVEGSRLLVLGGYFFLAVSIIMGQIACFVVFDGSRPSFEVVFPPDADQSFQAIESLRLKALLLFVFQMFSQLFMLLCSAIMILLQFPFLKSMLDNDYVNALKVVRREHGLKRIRTISRKAVLILAAISFSIVSFMVWVTLISSILLVCRVLFPSTETICFDFINQGVISSYKTIDMSFGHIPFLAGAIVTVWCSITLSPSLLFIAMHINACVSSYKRYCGLSQVKDMYIENVVKNVSHAMGVAGVRCVLDPDSKDRTPHAEIKGIVPKKVIVFSKTSLNIMKSSKNVQHLHEAILAHEIAHIKLHCRKIRVYRILSRIGLVGAGFFMAFLDSISMEDKADREAYNYLLKNKRNPLDLYCALSWMDKLCKQAGQQRGNIAAFVGNNYEQNHNVTLNRKIKERLLDSIRVLYKFYFEFDGHDNDHGYAYIHRPVPERAKNIYDWAERDGFIEKIV